MQTAPTTISTVRSVCKQVAINIGQEPNAYQPTLKQVFFFLLIQLHKKKFVFHTYEDVVPDLSEKDVGYLTQMTAKHLEEWGAMVAALKRRDEAEWELLRFQIEKSIRKTARQYRSANRDDLISEAHGNTLLKIFTVLNRLLAPQQIEETINILALLCTLSKENLRVYDFTSPFLAYANRIAHNELVTELRNESRQQNQQVSLEDFEDVIAEDSLPLTKVTKESEYEEMRVKLKQQLVRLLEIVKNDLSPKKRQVMLYTLLTRTPFPDVLEAFTLVFNNQSNFVHCSNDAQIATALGISENSVRVNRNNGKKHIAELDSESGALLENLLACHGLDDEEK